MKKCRGFTLIELLIVVAIIAILAAIAVPNFLEAQTRSKVSRCQSDHRSLATGLEAYYIDNNQYPCSQQGAGITNDGYGRGGVCISPNNTIAPNNPSFAVNNPGVTFFRTITTPSAFITSLFNDPFGNKKNIVFGYRSVNAAPGSTYGGLYGSGWVLTSYGPDTDQSNGGQIGGGWDVAGGTYSANLGVGWDLTPTETLYNPGVSQPSIDIILRVYDATNGTTSAGDIVRVKQ